MQIPNIFTRFSPKFFLTIFVVKSKLSTAKKSKTVAFSRAFTINNLTIFLGKSKLSFWTKNEDFEQCETVIFECPSKSSYEMLDVQLYETTPRTEDI